MSLKFQRLSYEQLKVCANDFLRQHHPDLAIPIPIEEILDLKFRINIIPFPDLLKYGIDAYTWSDLKNIVVDKFFYDRQLPRYRFTLAHELGHIMLHPEILKGAPRDSIDSYLKFVNSIGDEAHRWLEWQANCFAGLILVPSKPLLEKFREAEKMAATNGFAIDDLSTRGYIADWISDFFVVSSQVVESRLTYDGIWPHRKSLKKEK